MTVEFDAMRTQILKNFKNSLGEKTAIEILLENEGISKNLKHIGNAADIDSDFKNNIFEEIFEDENGHIIDLRLCYEAPDPIELEKMNEYWTILTKTFKKPVEPYIFAGE